jgi:alpha-ketoglutarate-dependent taurine dioxygenase
MMFRLKLDDGDAIIFDNHRTLHARTEFADPHRHLLKTAIVA